MTTAIDTAPRTAPVTKPSNKPRREGPLALGILAWIIGIVFVLPVLWMILTSFHSEADASTNPPSLGAG